MARSFMASMPTSSQTCRHAARTQSKLNVPHRSRRTVCRVTAQMAQQAEGQRTIVVKNQPGDLPFPWSEKDPYRLPLTIERLQQYMFSLGWEKPWVEQIVDRIMKSTLRTTLERATAVVDYLVSIGLKQDEICNMASISVVLLGLNPETRLKTVVDYLKRRGMPAESIPDLVLKHPRIFEYKLESPDAAYLVKGRARIQVDVLPLGPGGSMVAGVNYFRENAHFLESPVSPVGPSPM